MASSQPAKVVQNSAAEEGREKAMACDQAQQELQNSTVDASNGKGELQHSEVESEDITTPCATQQPFSQHCGPDNRKIHGQDRQVYAADLTKMPPQQSPALCDTTEELTRPSASYSIEQPLPQKHEGLINHGNNDVPISLPQSQKPPASYNAHQSQPEHQETDRSDSEQQGTGYIITSSENGGLCMTVGEEIFILTDADGQQQLSGTEDFQNLQITTEDGRQLLLTPVQSTSGEPLPLPSTEPIVVSTQKEEDERRWIVDLNFEQQRGDIKFPEDPSQWNKAQVQGWISWAIDQFQLKGITAESLKDVTGEDLRLITRDNIMRFLANDTHGETFWTHFQRLLASHKAKVPMPEQVQIALNPQISTTRPAKKRVILGDPNRSPTGNNGQKQIWQFLLELLTDKQHTDIIQWVGENGEFKFLQPATVAHLWGKCKDKPKMDYDKMSRALRYYYDGQMLEKVKRRPFTYKFLCDMYLLFGCSIADLRKFISK